MDARKKRKLEARGWRVGSTAEFLGLSAAESALVEMKERLGHELRALRKSRKLSQIKFAKLLNSSQSRVAKMESVDESVSIDLLMRGLVLLGATRKDIARTLEARRAAA